MSLKFHRQKNITSTNRLADPFFQRLIKENHMPEWKCACSRACTSDTMEDAISCTIYGELTEELALLKKELKRNKAGKTENYR